VIAVLQNLGTEFFIDLTECTTFAEIQAELYKKMESIADPAYVSGLNIVIGKEKISRAELRKIEGIVLDHGFLLNSLTANGPPEQSGSPENDTLYPEQLSQYQETALICRNLRSGQKFYTEGNVVILGDINPGAEVVAGGNILVMGVLRGMVHAGAFGDETVIVAAYRLNPTQLRIANHITRPPEGEEIIVEGPELARIKAGKVIIEKLKI